MENDKRRYSRPLSRAEGFELIEAYFRSGSRPCDYYKHNNLTEHQFYSWRRRYLAAHPELKRLSSLEKKIHPVRIEPPVEASLFGLEIHYPHGVRVVFDSGQPIAIEKLRALIQIQV